jgi:hypothetical protein
VGSFLGQVFEEQQEKGFSPTVENGKRSVCDEKDDLRKHIGSPAMSRKRRSPGFSGIRWPGSSAFAGGEKNGLRGLR